MFRWLERGHYALVADMPNLNPPIQNYACVALIVFADYTKFGSVVSTNMYELVQV